MSTNGIFDLQEGQTLGRHYYVVEPLGTGWEGEVYKVEERRTGIIRAAKLFYKRKGRRQDSLKRYAQKMYRLRDCPIVVQYLHRDVARIRGEVIEFMVSDLADGEVLSRYIERQKGKRLPPFEALHLLRSLALGVEQIHYLGEYHGDIHSDNIMVARRGLGFDVRLLDFFDLGRSTRQRIQGDVFDMIGILFEAIGGAKAYKTIGPEIRQIVLGRKHSLIRQHFRTAGQLRIALDNLDWD
ncbi:protein kinase [candidate division GN15 bacterium]|nr:protein kinase [candidate division GN15 bacterium]